MQVQEYQQPNMGLTTAGHYPMLPTGGDPRLQVPSSGYAPPPPSLMSVFWQELIKRKMLAMLWLMGTCVVAYLLITKYARPLYRAEGKMAYIPNYRAGMKPLYNPPNIQTMGQILKSMDGAEKVREKHAPEMSPDAFNKATRFEVSKLSEFLDSSFDSPDPEKATTIANALMHEATNQFSKYLSETLTQRTKELRQDYERAQNDVKRATERYRNSYKEKNIIDLKSEIETAKTYVLDDERALRKAQEDMVKLKTEIEVLKLRRDIPGTNPERSTIDESFMTQLQGIATEMNQRTQNVQVYEAARFRFDQLRQEEERTRELARRGIHPMIEYQRTVAELKSAEAIVRQHEEAKDALKFLQDKMDLLRKEMSSGKSLRLTTNTEIDRAEKELATIPKQIESYEASLKQKRLNLNKLLELQQDLMPLEQEITLATNRMTDLATQLTDSQYRDKHPNADDLKIATPASVGIGPFSTNTPKLAAAIFGISAVLFGGYLALFAIPKAMKPALVPAYAGMPSGLAPPQKPTAVLAVVPVAPSPPTTPAAPTAPATAHTPLTTTVTHTHTTTNIPVAPVPATKAPTPVPAPTPTPTPKPVPAVSQPPSVVPKMIELGNIPTITQTSTKPVEPKNSVSVATDHEIIIPMEAGDLPAVAPTAKPTKIAPLPRASLVLKDLGPAAAKPATAEKPAAEKPSMAEKPVMAEIKLPPPPKPEPKREPKPLPVPPPVEIVKKPEPAPAPQPTLPPVDDPGILQLANRITQEGIDRGSIVLFAPTAEQLSLSKIMGDLGRHLSQEGNRVLVFDARHQAEHPTWAGAQAPNVGKRVEGFLDGQTEATHCFIPTAMKNVEYSRADLASRVSGVMSAHRFRQLVEEMRERYSLVLMVAPTMILDGNDPLLAPLAEGLVVVAENTAMPSEIQNYINHIAEQISAPIYGALTVAKA